MNFHATCKMTFSQKLTKTWKSVCQQLIKMPFTIHLNPGVILPVQTSVHVFCVCYCFILYLHSFFSSFGQNLRGLELLKNRWHCPFNKWHASRINLTYCVKTKGYQRAMHIILKCVFSQQSVLDNRSLPYLPIRQKSARYTSITSKYHDWFYTEDAMTHYPFGWIWANICNLQYKDGTRSIKRLHELCSGVSLKWWTYYSW